MLMIKNLMRMVFNFHLNHTMHKLPRKIKNWLQEKREVFSKTCFQRISEIQLRPRNVLVMCWKSRMLLLLCENYKHSFRGKRPLKDIFISRKLPTSTLAFDIGNTDSLMTVNFEKKNSEERNELVNLQLD